VCGLVIVTNANPAGADASTVIGGLVVDVIEVFVRSDAVTVWLPTVFKVTVNWRKPFVSTPDVGDARNRIPVGIGGVDARREARADGLRRGRTDVAAHAARLWRQPGHDDLNLRE